MLGGLFRRADPIARVGIRYVSGGKPGVHLPTLATLVSAIGQYCQEKDDPQHGHLHVDASLVKDPELRAKLMTIMALFQRVLKAAEDIDFTVPLSWSRVPDTYEEFQQSRGDTGVTATAVEDALAGLKGLQSLVEKIPPMLTQYGELAVSENRGNTERHYALVVRFATALELMKTDLTLAQEVMQGVHAELDALLHPDDIAAKPSTTKSATAVLVKLHRDAIEKQTNGASVPLIEFTS